MRLRFCQVDYFSPYRRVRFGQGTGWHSINSTRSPFVATSASHPYLLDVQPENQTPVGALIARP